MSDVSVFVHEVPDARRRELRRPVTGRPRVRPQHGLRRRLSAEPVRDPRRDPLRDRRRDFVIGDPLRRDQQPHVHGPAAGNDRLHDPDRFIPRSGRHRRPLAEEFVGLVNDEHDGAHAALVGDPLVDLRDLEMRQPTEPRVDRCADPAEDAQDLAGVGGRVAAVEVVGAILPGGEVRSALEVEEHRRRPAVSEDRRQQQVHRGRLALPGQGADEDTGTTCEGDLDVPAEPVQADADRFQAGPLRVLRDARPASGGGGPGAAVTDPHDSLRRVPPGLD